MGLFGKKQSPGCPICQKSVPAGALMLHNVDHARPASDGQPGFMWSCGCGQQDGVWDDRMGAAAGLTQHMQRNHAM